MYLLKYFFKAFSMSPFKKKVIAAVNIIPQGQVASYGQIALMVGIPRGARQVGWVLNSLETDISKGACAVPWWRIINNAGRISIKGNLHGGAALQKKLLMQEGIHVEDDLSIDIEEYRFRSTVEDVKTLELDPEYIQMLIDRYGV